MTILPNGLTTRITSVSTSAGKVEEAFAPMAVAITLDDHIDISAGT